MVVELMTRKLIPQQRNANKHTLHGLRLLEKSIQSDGFIDAQTAAADGEIISGSARLELSAEKFADVEPIIVESDGSRPVVVVRTDIPTANDPRAKRLSVAANQIAKTDFNPDGELLAEWGGEDEAIRAMFADSEWEENTGEAKPTKDAEPQTDRAAELLEKWGVCEGDVWTIGNHRLLCGSSTIRENVARLFGDERARLTWTDPPYGVKYGDKMEATNPMGYRVRQIENDDLPADQLEEFIRSALTNAAEFSVKGGAIYVACPPGTLLPALISSFAGSGFDFRWGLVWLKDQIVLSRADYHFKHENILYGWKGDGPHYFTGDRTQSSVFEYPRPKKSEEHPTMKPVELIQHMLRNSSERGDIVYDAFGGSGSTMLACENEGRQCRMIELSPAFASVVLERMSQAFPSLEIKRLE
jgi:DNA modification methylase